MALTLFFSESKLKTSILVEDFVFLLFLLVDFFFSLSKISFMSDSFSVVFSIDPTSCSKFSIAEFSFFLERLALLFPLLFFFSAKDGSFFLSKSVLVSFKVSLLSRDFF